jgi:hypothetical protein
VKTKSTGQAAVEYLFVLVFMVILASRIVTRFNTFFRDSTGNLGHVLSRNLTVGVCPEQCFFGNYKNGFSP